MNTKLLAAGALALATLVRPPLAGAQQPAAAIDPAAFAGLHELIRPTAEESQWLAIPWQTSLWEARRKAAALGKPILLWEMDGHPLGCT